MGTGGEDARTTFQQSQQAQRGPLVWVMGVSDAAGLRKARAGGPVPPVASYPIGPPAQHAWADSFYLLQVVITTPVPFVSYQREGSILPPGVSLTLALAGLLLDMATEC